MKRRLMDVERKPDENTLLLLHFNGNIVDATDKVNVTINSGSATYTQGKFGKCLNQTLPKLYLQGSDLKFGSGNFTIDFWIYRTGRLSTWAGIFENSPYSNGDGLTVQVNGTNQIEAYYNDGYGPRTSQLPLNEWAHVAMVQDASNIKMFTNGILTGTKNDSRVTNRVDAYLFDRYGQNIRLTNALIDEFRISNVARWTSNFNVPTKPY